jgi:hypothetical protein
LSPNSSGKIKIVGQLAINLPKFVVLARREMRGKRAKAR